MAKTPEKITRTTVDLKPVTSSNVGAIGYDLARELFFVQWVGSEHRISMYSKVKKRTADQVLKAESKGKAIRALLIPTHAHEYVLPKAEPEAPAPVRRTK